MEALEEMGKLCCGDANSGIPDSQLHDVPCLAQSHGDLASERILHGIGQEVEDDLLPHVLVHIDRRRQRRTVHNEAQLGSLAGRAESASQIDGQCGQVGRLIHRLHAARLEAREIQEGIHELLEPEAVALHDGEQLPMRRQELGLRQGEEVFERTEQQRQRCTEFVAHVAEKGGLGAIQLGEHLSTAALLFVGAGIRDGRRDPRRREIKEVAVVAGQA